MENKFNCPTVVSSEDAFEMLFDWRNHIPIRYIAHEYKTSISSVHRAIKWAAEENHIKNETNLLNSRPPITTVFTVEEEDQIITEFNTGHYNQRELAERFNTSRSTISRILKGVKVGNVVEVKQPAATFNPDDARAIITPSSIALQLPEESARIISSDHVNFGKVKNAIAEKDFQNAYDMMDVKQAIEKYSFGRVKIEGETLLIDGRDVGSTQQKLITKIIQMMGRGDNDFVRLVKFIDNAYLNPSQKVVSRIYDFISAEDIQLDEEGMIIAWKFVRSDFLDCYSGSIDNSPGQMVSMPRNEVMDDENVTCSTGLHVCSVKYFKGFSGERFVKIRIHPKDVVSIPIDYNDAKMRVCEYFVLEEVKLEDIIS